MNNHKISDFNKFDTFVVGSLPRPVWVQRLIEENKYGEKNPALIKDQLDNAIPMAVEMQKAAGVTYISDGEWRRESYVKIFAESVDGFTLDLSENITPNAFSLKYPAVTSKISQIKPIAVNELKFLKSITNKKITVAIPSPYTIGRRMWSAKYSKQAYPERKTFIEHCVPILKKEISDLNAAGADSIQIDDPWLSLLVDKKYREENQIKNIDAEIEISVDSLNSIVDQEISSLTSVHFCHAHFNRQHGSFGSYHPIIEALGLINVDRFAMEFASPVSEGTSVLKHFPKNKIIGLGVIDHTNTTIEQADSIVSQVNNVMNHISPENITLNPDCGFAPSSANPMNFDEAYLKLTSMVKASNILKGKFG
tara:strand:+ start:1408 stop:2505 length:1098 start_codon:yes stop_codon:yes gene_type:complete